MNPDPNRRRVLLATAAWLLASGARAATRWEPTPAQSAGPFYPTEPPLDDDQDLTPVRGALGLAQGRIKLAVNFDLILGVTPHG
jgi:protocatechuate 3,4-dioxygenase beta subunit